jgi:GNAT superfamily N-acetyltransferase
VTVRKLEPRDVPAVVDIVKRSPDYFTPDVPEKVVSDAPGHDRWVLEADDGVIGFAVVARARPRSAEVEWIGIDPDHRGRGHGTALLEAILAELVAAGTALVEAKTLDATAGYAPYEATRAFWETNGFVQIDMIDPLPGWQTGNPCALYVAALRATR